ncbi:MAG: hypothetical protein ACK5RL_01570 [Acidimicrobiales bacterium]
MASSRAARTRSVLIACLATVALTATACTDGPGSEEDLVNALTRDDGFDQAQAECIANAVFNEYGENEDALKAISSAPDMAALDAEGGVPGFSEFFDRTVQTCSGSLQ